MFPVSTLLNRRHIVKNRRPDDFGLNRRPSKKTTIRAAQHVRFDLANANSLAEMPLYVNSFFLTRRGGKQSLYRD